jgi:hypothetical protein
MQGSNIQVCSLYKPFADSSPDPISHQMLLVVTRLGSCINASKACFYGIVHQIGRAIFLPCCPIY